MSITQTYYLAHKARAKLSSEAARSDHDLRLLVGHANLLDSLMLELADAEREQESWFNQSVRGAAAKSEDRHIQWADTIQEDEEDWVVDESSDSSDSDSDSEADDESEAGDEEEDDVEMADMVPVHRVASHSVSKIQSIVHIDELEEAEDDLEEDYAQLELVRTTSHSSSPPDLDDDLDSSDDESMPPSPPTAVLHFSEKDSSERIQQHREQQQESRGGKSFYSEGFYLPSRNPARLVSAISVY